MILQKLQYLARSAVLFPSKTSACCPNCGSASSEEVDRKYYLTRLVRCDDCRLMYRTPVESEEFNKKFYNFHYVQGTTTEYPDAHGLERLKSTDFAGSEQNYAGYISFMKRHGVATSAKLFDFGCSWGYGSYQMSKAGLDVHSYEIGVERRNYGIEKLGVNHIDEPYAIKPGHEHYESFDCFFSAHVLEHVPAPSKIIDLAWQCLKPGGAFIAFTPNGCDEYRKCEPQRWSRMWGSVHPNFLDDIFYDKQFSHSKKHYDSRDGSDVRKYFELGFVAYKDPKKCGF